MNMYMMATSRLEAVGYLCGILTWLGSMAVVSIPDWKHSILEKEGSYQGFIIARGLWSECTLKNTGSVECQRLNEPFFVLPITYRVCRVFTVSAVTFAFIAVVATPAGMKCTRMGGSEPNKSRLIRVCALFYATSSLLVGISVSWFAKNVADEFTLVPTDDFFELDLRYDFGQALYVGWATMATGIISSSVLILTSLKFRQRENYNSSGQLPSSRFKTDYELAETPLVRSKVSTKRSQNTTLTDAIQRQAKTYNCSTSILNPALSESRVCSCGPVKSNCCVAKKTYV